ncbi:MAG: NAD(P)H-binding protein [bacterium]|nr:NAD(P)H-binding protein [bacterium]
MKIIIFGSNGKVGSIVVQKALDAGHYVTAFVHGAANFTEHSNLKIVKGDIYDPASVKSAFEGSEVIISALGSWGTPKKDILSTAMSNIVPAMKNFGIKRIISLTGHDARWSKDSVGIINRLTRPMLALVVPKILHDGERHIELLSKSGLDWTVLRSPVMNEKGAGLYKLTGKRPFPWQTINRHAVAQALIDQVEGTENLNEAPFLTRG